jgi:hypothetical protein
VVILALIGGGYLYWRLDDEIGRHVKKLFADHYKQLIVEVGSARYEQGNGVFINQLSIAEPREDGRPQPVLSIDELFLDFDAGIEELMSGKPHINRIVVRRPRLRAVRLADGRWNVAALVPLPKFSDDTPEMFIEDATLILEDASRHSVAPLSLRAVDLKLTPCPPDPTKGKIISRALTISGNTNGAPARSLTFTGTISPDDGTFDFSIVVQGLEVSPELIAAIPGPLPSEVHTVELYASSDAQVHLARTGPGGENFRWSADVSLNRGRVSHALLPQPITELTGKITADNSKLAVKDLTGKVGAADFVLAFNRQGWAANAPLGLAGRVHGLVVNADLQAALPTRLEKLWQRFRPNGIVDAEVQLTYDGSEWRPVLKAECHGMALTDAEKFPYPIQNANGTISLTRSPTSGTPQLDLDLVGMASGRPIHIAAKVDRLMVPKIPVAPAVGTGAVAFGDVPPEADGVQFASATTAVSPASKPTGWVDVSGTGVAIHEQLLAALRPKDQVFVRSLWAQGLVDFRWRWERTDPAAPTGDTSLDLKLVDCAIKFEKFPYPLEQIAGNVTARNGHFNLTGLTGRDRQGAANVTLDGQADASEAGLSLALVIRGENVPLDENLKQALKPKVQQVWNDLRPQGRVNFVANVQRQLGQLEPQVQVEVTPFEQTVSVEPIFFPYRFEQVGGRAVVTEGRVELQQLKGIHGQSLFTAAGVWQAATDGGWQLDLTGLNVDRLAFETDFLRAVPPGVQKVLDRIRPTGNFNAYNSTLRFARRPDLPNVAAQWDIQLACHHSSLRGDLPLENITGGVRLMGESNGPSVTSYGELAIDSLIWNDMQFTNLRGPMWSDATVCYLGQQATAKLAQPPRSVTANIFGGTIAANTVLEHAGQPRYRTEISIGNYANRTNGIDLGRFARERLGGPSDLTGFVFGTLSLAGTGRATYSLTGKGDIHVVDANIYQLPPLVAMLSVLKNRTPDSTAFDRCDMKFDVYGENIHFNQLNLLGDAVSLYGRGQTNFDRRLDLTFYTLLGPADLPIPLWKTVAGHVSEQGLQIKVGGTWDNPQPHREAFPMVNQMLEQFRTEAEQGAAAVVPPAAAGIPWVSPPR